MAGAQAWQLSLPCCPASCLGRALQSSDSRGVLPQADSCVRGFGRSCCPSALLPVLPPSPRSGAPLSETMTVLPATPRSVSPSWDSCWDVLSFATLVRTRRSAGGLWMLFITSSDSSCSKNVREAVVGCVLPHTQTSPHMPASFPECCNGPFLCLLEALHESLPASLTSFAPLTAASRSSPAIVLLQKLNAHHKSRTCSSLLSCPTPLRTARKPAVSWPHSQSYH